MIIKHNFLIIVILLIYTIIINACKDGSDKDNESIVCYNLMSGIINKDADILANEINELTKDLEPTPSDSDGIGHEHNLEILASRINDQCNEIMTEILCYACIKTNPPQSEILVQTDSSGKQISRIIDILTPDDDILTFHAIHD